MPYKIAHLTSVHPSLDIRIFYKECKSLVEDGYEVVLVAPSAGERPTLSEVRFHALKPPRSRLRRFFQTIPALLKAAVNENAALYHFHDPELIGVGIVLKVFGKKVVYDVHEDVPRQILSKPWIRPSLRRTAAMIAQRAERLAAVLLDGIVVANPDVVQNFPAKKTILVQNYPILGELDLLDRVPYEQRPYAAAYVGSITETRGVFEMVDAMDALRSWPNVRLLLGGEFAPSELRSAVQARHGWDLVEFRGFLARAQVADTLSQARVGLVILHQTPNYQVIQPTKLFEYMSAGIPVIASNNPSWRAILERSESGFWVDPHNVAEVVERIDWIFRHPVEAKLMGERGRAFALQNFDWRAEFNNLSSLYRKILKHDC